MIKTGCGHLSLVLVAALSTDAVCVCNGPSEHRGADPVGLNEGLVTHMFRDVRRSVLKMQFVRARAILGEYKWV